LVIRVATRRRRIRSQPEAEPIAASNTPDWLAAMQPDDEPEAESSDAVLDDTPDWLTAMQQPNEAQPVTSRTPATATSVPDWLDEMHNEPVTDADQSLSDDEWNEAAELEPETSSDAPEDEPVETEFLPTNKAASTPSKPAKESKARPEFGWLLDIVNEESQQVTVVADKTALRRFVFSKLPTWLRRPTEQPDKSPAGESEADNVDIPPWLQ